MLVTKRADELHPGDRLIVMAAMKPVTLHVVTVRDGSVFVDGSSRRDQSHNYTGNFPADMLMEVLV